VLGGVTGGGRSAYSSVIGSQVAGRPPPPILRHARRTSPFPFPLQVDPGRHAGVTPMWLPPPAFHGSEFKRRESQTAGRRTRPPSELGNRLEIVFLDSELLDLRIQRRRRNAELCGRPVRTCDFASALSKSGFNDLLLLTLQNARHLCRRSKRAWMLSREPRFVDRERSPSAATAKVHYGRGLTKILCRRSRAINFRVATRSAGFEAFLSKEWSAPCRMAVDTISTVPESRCVIRTITVSGNPAPKLGDAAPPASFHLNVAKDRF
jgi:hypothetical protein